MNPGPCSCQETALKNKQLFESYSYTSPPFSHCWVSSVFHRVYLIFLIKSISLPSHLLDYEIRLLNKPRVVQMSTQEIIRTPRAAAFSHSLKGK